MIGKKSKNDETEILSPEELCFATKNTLKSYIKVSTLLGVTTGLAAGVTLLTPTIEDSKKRNILIGTGAALTSVCIGATIVCLSKMDEMIDNHDDALQLQVVGRFLHTKGDDAIDDLIDSIITEINDNMNT